MKRHLKPAGLLGAAALGRRGRALVAATMALTVALAAALIGAGPASAASGPSVSITPATDTVASGTSVTYTLAVSCTNTGGCTGTTVSFPSTAITGDGSTTDFAAWVSGSSCSGVTRTATGGTVTYTYGTMASGVTKNCTFAVKPPNNLTFDGTQITITPTISGTNFASNTGNTATLNVTATKNATVGKTVSGNVLAGLPFQFNLAFFCGTSAGTLGVTDGTITDPLPSGFTYTGYLVNNVAGTGGSYNAGTNTFTYADSTNKSCGDTIEVLGTPSSGGTADAVGTKICNQATGAYSFVDGSTTNVTSANVCTTVTALQTQASKSVASTATGTAAFSGDGLSYSDTFPGDWDHSGATVTYNLQIGTKPAQAGAGVAYRIQDPFPCLDGASGGVVSSPAPGSTCAHPAFVPAGKVTVVGFTPTAADSMTAHFADGTSTTVAYAAGGWAVPTSGTVTEIDFPAFSEEGNNSGNSNVMTFSIDGYAATSAPIGDLLKNTLTSSPFAAGTSDAVDQVHQSTASILVADPDGSAGVIVEPSVYAAAQASCVDGVNFNSPLHSAQANRLQFATGSSAELDYDLLAPAGATVTPSDLSTKFAVKFTLQGITNGQSFTTSAAIAPTVTTDYKGTGRDLYVWVIPAGLATVPGRYQINPSANSLPFEMPGGCTGVVQNDATLGYGATIGQCFFDNYTKGFFQAPPMNPTADGDLNANSVGGSNYCGMSAAANFSAINPGFSVTKTVQGDLDSSVVDSGGTGNVTPAGGTATYDITFTNSGAASLTNAVVYDLLPAVGDTDVISTDARGSQFGVTLTGVGTIPTGVTVEYSTAANPCRPQVLANADNPGCVDDWSATPPSPLSGTTALQLTYAGTLVVTGTSGTNGFSVPFTVSTPSVATNQVAWNTVGAVASAGGTPLTPAESSKTGLKAEQVLDTPMINGTVGGGIAAIVVLTAGGLVWLRRRRSV